MSDNRVVLNEQQWRLVSSFHIAVNCWVNNNFSEVTYKERHEKLTLITDLSNQASKKIVCAEEHQEKFSAVINAFTQASIELYKRAFLEGNKVSCQKFFGARTDDLFFFLMTEATNRELIPPPAKVGNNFH